MEITFNRKEISNLIKELLKEKGMKPTDLAQAEIFVVGDIDVIADGATRDFSVKIKL